MDEQATTTTRRRFLGTAAGATGVALGAAVWGANQAAAAAIPGEAAQRLPAADKRSFVSGKFALELDGIGAGWLRDADGGQAFADVVTEKVGPDHIAHKHLAGVKYEDITVTSGTGMSKNFYSWIAASWKTTFARKDGSIIAADFNLQAKSVREFVNGLITETTIPAMDASSKDAAFMTVKFAPEFVRNKNGSGKVDQPVPPAQKKWLPSNFRLEIDGLDCTRVNKIDAFTVKLSVVSNSTGELSEVEVEPAHVEFPNLVITFAESSAASWQKWFETFVVQSNNGDEQEKSGTLTFLAPDLKSELGKVSFFHLGIFKLDDDASEDASGSVIQRVKAELYCERMEFQFGPATNA